MDSISTPYIYVATMTASCHHDCCLLPCLIFVTVTAFPQTFQGSRHELRGGWLIMSKVELHTTQGVVRWVVCRCTSLVISQSPLVTRSATLCDENHATQLSLASLSLSLALTLTHSPSLGGGLRVFRSPSRCAFASRISSALPSLHHHRISTTSQPHGKPRNFTETTSL